MSKKICSAVLLVCLLVSLLTLPVSAYDVDVIEGVIGYNTNQTFEMILADGNLKIWGSGAMPDYKYVTYPMWYDYRDCVKTITLQNTITTIGDNSFYYCHNLSSISMGNITRIGEFAFHSNGFTSLNLPSSLKTIGDAAFVGGDFKTLVIPDSVTSIGTSTFANCEKMENLTIGRGLTTIPASAFYGSWALKSIVIPDNITTIGETSFGYSKEATDLKIGSGVTEIGNRAFEGCDSLTSIVIPSNVKTIGNNAFQYSDLISNVKIEGGNTTVGDNAFSYCYALSDLQLGEGVTSIGAGAFYNCTKLTNLVLPDSLTKIGNSAFASCPNIKTITLGTGITEIPYRALNSNALTDVYYKGTKEQWNAIKIDSSNTYLLKANIHCLGEKYTVSYDANGGSNAPSAQQKKEGETVVVSTVAPVRENYTFTGWNTKADGNGTVYAPGSNYTEDSDVTLYAQWEPIKYTVTYDASGGTASVSSKTVEYGKNADLTVTASKEGYKFLGWNTDENATEALASCVVTDDVVLYAIYSEALTGIVLDSDGYYRYYKDGVVQTGWQNVDGYRYYFSSSSSKYGAAMTSKNIKVGGTYYDFTDEGKLIAGYDAYGNALLYLVDPEDTYITKGSDGYYRYYIDGEAQTGWQITPVGYKYYFSSSSSKYGAAMTGTNKKVGSSYYDFAEDGKLISSYDDSGKAEYFYDPVQGVVYTVTYDGNGGEVTLSSKKARVTTNADLTVAAEKIGYNFLGWNTDKNATETISSLVVDKNITLYAIYEESETGTTGVILDADGYYRYYVNGVIQTGWQTTSLGHKYYFSTSSSKYGAAMTGTNKKVGSAYYDFTDDGKLIESYDEDGNPVLYQKINGFVTDDSGNTKYYVDSVPLKGWQYINGYKYYFSTNSENLLKGYTKIGSIYYNLDSTDGHWIGYYQESKAEDECLKSDLLTKGSDGKYRYYVDGIPYTGWKVLKGDTGYYKYYFSKSSALNGAAITTYATTVGSEIFDFSPTGTLITVTRDDNGNAVMSDYILSFEQGAKNGLILDDDGEYRYYIDGEFQSGWQKIDGEDYLFRRADGSAITSDDHNEAYGGYKYGRLVYIFNDEAVLQRKFVY